MNQPVGITLRGQRPSAMEGMRLLREPVRSLYIHIPFCFHKCHYCDFYSFVDTQDRQPVFLKALLRELSAHAAVERKATGAAPKLTSIFVGGGTPSLLRIELWAELLEALHAEFDLTDPGLEFTVECNPETVTLELMQLYASRGINRVSIGAQSFHEAHLKTLERWHDPANVSKALSLAEAAGIRRRNIDLIFAIPGQTLGEWELDLDRALALTPGVDHLSCYALTYEPNTAMTKRLKAGDFAPAEEDLEADMYALCVEKLRSHGFDRYEVSNFATQGSECRHNLAYWRQDQWFATGPSASAHIGGARWKNVPRLTDWLEGVEASGGMSPVTDLELPEPTRALSERLMTGMRLAEGVDGAAALRDAERLGAADRLQRELQRQREFGLVEPGAQRWQLTDRGFLLADGVAAALMGSLES